MGFLGKLFGKGKLIEVPNNWGIGDSTPLLVERQPDLESIFSDPNPSPPQQLTERNRSYWESQDPRGIRCALAVAYLSHPAPEVRAATIRLVKSLNAVGIRQMLVDLLADSSSDVRSAAVEAIWDAAKSPDPDANSVAFAIRCLRDEIQQTGFISHMSPEQALLGLVLLGNARPERRADFNKWLVYAWCRSDEELAEYGYKLLHIYSQHGTFSGTARQACRQVGAEIGSSGVMQALHDAILLALGPSAAKELETTWSGTAS